MISADWRAVRPILARHRHFTLHTARSSYCDEDMNNNHFSTSIARRAVCLVRLKGVDQYLAIKHTTCMRTSSYDIICWLSNTLILERLLIWIILMPTNEMWPQWLQWCAG